MDPFLDPGPPADFLAAQRQEEIADAREREIRRVADEIRRDIESDTDIYIDDLADQIAYMDEYVLVDALRAGGSTASTTLRVLIAATARRLAERRIDGEAEA